MIPTCSLCAMSPRNSIWICVKRPNSNGTSEMLGDPARDVLPHHLFPHFIEHFVPHPRVFLVLFVRASDAIEELSRRRSRCDRVFSSANHVERQLYFRRHLPCLRLGDIRLVEPPRGHAAIVEMIPLDGLLRFGIPGEHL